MDKEIQEAIDYLKWFGKAYPFVEECVNTLEAYITLQEKIKELMAKGIHSAMGWDWQISSAYVDKNFIDLAKKELGL